MPLPYSARDKAQITERCILALYEKTIIHVDLAVWEIGNKNSVLMKWIHPSFNFRGKTYLKPEEKAIGIPNLHKSLMVEMEEVWRIETRILIQEANYIRSLLNTAISYSNSLADLIVLLPEQALPYLPNVIRESASEQTLLDADVMAFKQKHQVSIAMLNKRLTKNLLGNYL